jgi:hypothetical protein
MIVVLIALLSSAWAEDEQDLGPMPHHEVTRPVGIHRGADATLPGAPHPCVAKAQVFVPWSVCRSAGASSSAFAQAVRFDGVTATTPVLPGGACGLSCAPEDKLANWSFLLPSPGWRGTISCTVGRNTVKLTIAAPDAGATDGTTIQWQSDLSVTEYIVDPSSLIDGQLPDLRTLIFQTPRWLSDESTCQAGQPRGPAQAE